MKKCVCAVLVLALAVSGCVSKTYMARVEDRASQSPQLVKWTVDGETRFIPIGRVTASGLARSPTLNASLVELAAYATAMDSVALQYGLAKSTIVTMFGSHVANALALAADGTLAATAAAGLVYGVAAIGQAANGDANRTTYNLVGAPGGVNQVNTGAGGQSGSGGANQSSGEGSNDQNN